MSYLRTLRAALVAAIATTGVLASFNTAPAVNAATAQPMTFTADGIGGQTWTVPDGITVVTITATGGSGTDGSTGSSGGQGGAGGKGATVVATIDVAPGDTLQIDPGGNGDHPSWGDQGYAAGPVSYYANAGGHGGNATVVRRNGSIVAIAGGGGGGGGGSRLPGFGWNGGAGGDGGGFWGTAGDGYIAGESGHGPILGYDTGVGEQGGAEAAYSPAGGGGSGGGGYNPIMAQGGGHGGFGGNFPGGGGGGGAGGSSFAVDPSATFGVAGVYGDGSVSLQVRPHQTLTASADSSARNHPVTMTDTLTSLTGGPTPTGTVTWYLIDVVNGGRTNESTVPLVNGTSSWTLPVGLPLGPVYVGATYNGDSNYMSSTYYGYSLPVVGDYYGWTVAADHGTDFGTIALGMGSSLTFHATNTGTFPNVPVITTSNPDFAVYAYGCAQLIAPGQSCMFGVSFRSAIAETATASLYVTASGVHGPAVTLSLRGQTVFAAMSLGSPSVSFANVPVGTTATRSLTVVNTGEVQLHVRATPASSKFTVDRPCDVPVSGDCTFSITYTPTVIGTDDTTLKISTDYLSVVTSVPVTANSVAPLPAVSISPSPLAFGTTTLGVPISRTVTATNTGSVSVTVTSVAVSSPDLSVNSSTCSAALAPGSTCTFRVTFTPRYAGASKGQLYVNLSNGQRVTTTVSGNGASRLPRISRISPTFGPAAGGTLVTITGTDILPATAVLFGSVSVPTRCTATSCTAYAPAGTKGTVDVRVVTWSGTSAVTSSDRFTYR